MSNAGRVAAVAGVSLSVLVGFMLVPAVSFSREVDFGTPAHPFVQTIQDGGSLSYLLLGVGTAPFSRPVVKIVAINGTLYTLNYTSRGGMAAEMRPGTPVPNPVVLEAVRAVLNNSQIASVIVLMGFKNTGALPVDLLIAVDQQSYASVKGLGAGQTQVVTTTVYPYPAARQGDVFPIDVQGRLVNGSFFGFHSSVTVASG